MVTWLERRPGWLMLACLLLAALASIAMRQDASFDLKNYHIYNAWALLQGRTLDMAPASLQSYFNPLIDVPYFLLASGPLQHLPRVLAAWQGLANGCLLFLMFRLASQLAAQQARRFGFADLCAVLIGATGTMSLSQLGSTTHEVMLGVLIVAALNLLLPLCREVLPRKWALHALLAGLCAGLAAGLKPTAIVWCPALVVALLFAMGPLQLRAWKAAIVMGLAMLTAFALSYGWWGWHLYQLTGNPTFPMFNNLFHSDWIPAASVTDLRFLPRNIGQWLLYPFYWLSRDNTGLVTELNMADPRYALAMLAVAALGVSAWVQRKQTSPARDGRGAGLIVCFAIVGYLLWLALFSILRYAIAIEALTGILILMAAYRLTRSRWSWHGDDRRPGYLMLALLIATIAASIYPNWGRTGFAHEAFEVDTGEVEPGSLVVFTGQPAAYLAPFFAHSSDIEFVGISWLTIAADPYRFGQMTRERLREHRGPIYVVYRDGSESEQSWLRSVVPSLTEEACRPIRSHIELSKRGRDQSGHLVICKLHPGSPDASS